MTFGSARGVEIFILPLYQSLLASSNVRETLRICNLSDAQYLLKY